MNQAPRFSRRTRWAVPSGAVAAVGVVVAGSVLTGAAAAPVLPARTPAQLIAAIAANKSVPASLSGTIVTGAALGLPNLPGTGDPASIASLLTGSHTIKIWYARPGRLRLALPVQLGETDLRVNGRQVWLWDSQANTATHVLPPAVGGPDAPLSSGWMSSSGSMSSSGMAHSSAKPGSASTTYSANGATSPVTAFAATPTPQQLAQRLLAAIGPTTAVSVQRNITIAGRPAYQLVLAPKNPASLIGRVAIAVDASRYIPLRVQVFARGAASPGYQVGFTSISFARPAASNFTFTPPPGAKVKTVRPSAFPLAAFPLVGLPAGALSVDNGGGFIRAPHRMIACPSIRAKLKGKPTGRRILPAKCARFSVGLIKPGKCYALTGPLPKGSLTMNPLRASKNIRIGMPKRLSGSQRQHLLKQLRKEIARPRHLHPCAVWQGAGWYGYAPGTGETFPAGAAGMPRVIGSGWTAVGVFPAAGLTSGSAGGPAGVLLRSATAVHGSWGSGRLLRTSLLSVLITSNGKLLIGAVTPSVLYAAAAQAK
jgi:outer membrane lipoprotein-sorting protein